ncbi:hypothetical protein [Marinimicrobium sp. ARAG 43.8]|uniref:HvfA family oxazolone/thioamide-modified RiPP metallophore n=1 Tax=Marinimicrobium sp. ARAG 43.8 TaxID=3418719 RepID=UPI003CF0076F
MKSIKTPLIASAGAAMLLGLGAQAAVAENPFSAEPLAGGYTQLAEHHGDKKDGEGKCGEGKCGEKKEKKDKKERSHEHKDGEGKCGEGKCGG